jgi:hypothetical protein
MNETTAIIAIIIGAAAIVLGFTVKQFYAAKGMYCAVGGHPIARWKGRLLFIVGGAGFLLIGFSYFFFHMHQ